MADPLPILTAERVTKVLGTRVTTEALRCIDLKVMPGEFVAIAGPSGSGKSTLLYLLGALDRPTTGRVRIGRDYTDTLADRDLARLRNRSVGFVFQFHFLLSELSAWENVALPMRLAGANGSAAAFRSRELLEAVGLGDRLDYRPVELSSGQLQRVTIARALVNQPLVVLADEPTGNLDRANSHLIFELLHRLNRDTGQTVVVVTHDRELSAGADRQLELVDGRITGEIQGDEPWVPSTGKLF